MTENFKRLLAHKLGNLVMLARNPVEMLDEPGLPDDQRAQLRAMLIESLENMEQICRDLTDLGRLEEIWTEQREHYQPGLSFQNTVQQISDSPASSGYTITYRELTPLPGELIGYPDLIERAIEKLIENAIKFSPEGSTITVEAFVEGDQLAVRVTDHGLGIPPEHQARIFEPFYRFKDRQTSRLPGLGLGLAVAWSVAQVHGGTITVRSAPGEGSTFTLLLPLTEASDS